MSPLRGIVAWKPNDRESSIFAMPRVVIVGKRTSRMLNVKQILFPALRAACIYMLFVLIGCFGCLRHLWLAKVVTMILNTFFSVIACLK